MVISFKLSGISSIFQKYINWILKDYLDDFCSVYLDNILIFLKKSLQQHREYVYKVLNKLKKTSFHLNIIKCEFEIIIIKYLNFIIKTDRKICINYKKIKIIQE